MIPSVFISRAHGKRARAKKKDLLHKAANSTCFRRETLPSCGFVRLLANLGSASRAASAPRDRRAGGAPPAHRPRARGRARPAPPRFARPARRGRRTPRASAAKSGLRSSVPLTRPGKRRSWCMRIVPYIPLSTTSDDDRRPVLHGGRELARGHQEVAVAREADDVALRVDELRGDRRREAVAHRAAQRRELGAVGAEHVEPVRPDGEVAGAAREDRLGPEPLAQDAPSPASGRPPPGSGRPSSVARYAERAAASSSLARMRPSRAPAPRGRSRSEARRRRCRASARRRGRARSGRDGRG